MIFKAYLLVAFSFLLMLLNLNSAMAQKRKDVRDIIMSGNEYYFQDQFSKAIAFYEKAITIDSLNAYANYYLAECHRKTFNFKEAEQYYLIVVENSPREFPLAGFYYPQMQKFNGKFGKAISNFDAFIVFAKTINFAEEEEFLAKAVIERKGCYFAIAHLENPFGEYNLTNLPEPINSQYNDYGPFILENDSTIGLTSGRSTVTGKILNNRYGEYFSDNFRFIKDSTAWSAYPTEDNFKINNTEFGEGAGSYSAHKEVFYFTGCYEDGSYCKIYKSEKKGGLWQAPVEVESPINLKNSDNKQPSITNSGDTLFFVSDRVGGFGGNDIWMSIKNAAGKWQTPINLGEKINTPYNEISPFYYGEDDVLFFASDGHEGLGGLDIFMAKGGIGNIQLVENIGYPFNSNHDDGYMVLGNKVGYFASNRMGGLGNFDIYQFNIVTHQSIIAEVREDQQHHQRVLRSRVHSRTGGEVYVMREEDQFFYENLKRDEKTTLAAIIAAKLDNLEQNKELVLSPSEKAFLESLPMMDRIRLDRMVRVLHAAGNREVDKFMSAIPARNSLFNYQVISGKLFDNATDKPAPGVLIPLVDEAGKIVKETTTNDDGTFKYLNLPLNRQYRILAENIPKKITESARFNVKNLEIKEVIKKPVAIRFENIYFDLNEKGLRPEAKKVMDEIIEFYKSNPQIQIEIYAYTDARGADEHNYQLSKARGKSVYDYLIAGNVKRSSLVIEAQGKDISAYSEFDQVNLQLNRRVEFNIVGATNPYVSPVKTYILKQNLSVEQLARITANTAADIKKLNGLAGSTIPAYTPVRIKSDEKLNIPGYLYSLPEEGKKPL